MSAVVRLVRAPAVLLADGTLGPGSRVAPMITDPLIPTERVALLRAQAELDRIGVRRMSISGTIPAPDTAMEIGSVGRLIDHERPPMAAKLTAITYTISISDDGREVTADAALTLERIDD